MGCIRINENILRIWGRKESLLSGQKVLYNEKVRQSMICLFNFRPNCLYKKLCA